MLYIKDTNGRYKTLKELAEKYDLPVKLIRGRHMRGLRTVEELTQPQHQNEK